MTWGLMHAPSHRAALVELDFDSVEFIALELPQGDGFTRDWWNDVYLPMVKLREEREREREDRTGP